MIIPNILNHGTCPYCNALLNCLDYLPISCLGSKNDKIFDCPVCKARLEGRIKITFDVELHKAIKD